MNNVFFGMDHRKSQAVRLTISIAVGTSSWLPSQDSRLNISLLAFRFYTRQVHSRKKFHDNRPKMLKQIHLKKIRYILNICVCLCKQTSLTKVCIISRLPMSLEPLPIGQTIPEVSSGQFRRTGSCWKFCTVIGLQPDILLSFYLNGVDFDIETTPQERMLMTMHITLCFCHRLSLLTY